MFSPARRAVASLLFASLAVACAAPAEEDTSSNDSAMGERWRSPVQAGAYDGANAVVSVQNMIDGQRATFSTSYVFAAGSVSLEDGRAEVEGDEDSFTMASAPNGDIDVTFSRLKRGAYPAERFTRRKVNALQGTFPHLNQPWRIVVGASTDDTIDIELTRAGAPAVRTRLEQLHFTTSSAGFFTSDALPNCTFTVDRYYGQYVLKVLSHDDRCPVVGSFVREK